MNKEHIPQILIATDYSEAAHIAEMYAIQMAKDTGFNLRYLHIYEKEIRNPLQVFNSEKRDIDPVVFETEKLKKHASEMLVTINISEAQLNLDYVVREGEAGEQILKETKENPVDFIIVGTHGVSGFKEFFVGSNAWAVIKNSDAPVLAIPAEGVYQPVRKIVFASEYRDGEIPAIYFVNKLANFLKSSLSVVHIINPFLDQKLEQKLYEEFKAGFDRMIIKNKPEIVSQNHDDVAEGLDRYCSKNSADWLVMSPEIPTLLEKIFIPGVSMTRKMSFLTSIPLLCIPDYYSHRSETFWNDF